MTIDRRAVAIGACALCAGITLQVMLIFPIWLPAWMSDFHQPRGPVLLIYSAGGILMNVAMTFVGRLLTRTPVWQVFLAGGIVLGGGLIVASMVTSYALFAVIYALAIGIGVASSSVLPSQALAAQLFPERVSAIAGLLMIAMAATGVAFPPLFTAVKAAIGWRETLAAAGVGVLILVPLLAVTLIRLPAAATAVAGETDRHDAPPPMSTKAILGTTGFWLIMAGWFPLLAAPTAVQANFLPLLADHGVDAAGAGFGLSIIAAGAASGAILFGWLGDRFDPRLMLFALASLTAAAVIVYVAGEGATTADVASFLLGLSSGGMLSITSTLTFRQFGSAYAPAFGLLNTLMLPYMLAPALVGFIRDKTGSYSIALLVAVPVLLLGAAAAWRLKLSREVSGKPAMAH